MAGPEDSRLTDSQKRALGEVGADRVRWHRQELRYFSNVFPPAVRSDVVQRLRNRDLIDVGSSPLGGPTYRVFLTAAGREVLARQKNGEDAHV